LLGIAIGIVLLVVGVQTYYHFTPVALSAETLALNARAAKIPTITENGYRLNGLLAPRALDAVQFGRCRADASEAHRLERDKIPTSMPTSGDRGAIEAYFRAQSDRLAELSAECLKGGVRITLPHTLESNRIRIGLADAQWLELANATPDPVIVARALAVHADGPRRLGTRVDSPMPEFAPLLHFERWNIARARVAWQTNDRAAAIAAWQRTINHWTKSAEYTLIDAMLSAAAISQTLVAMQQSLAYADRVDDVTAAAMLESLKPIESMKETVTASLMAEWQTMSTVVSEMTNYAKAFESTRADPYPSFSTVTIDINDSLNVTALAHLSAEQSVSAAARGITDTPRQFKGLTRDCEWLGDNDVWCLPFLRNPFGRALAGIATPNYADYGTRIADLRNFAAVTRLTIEARRRGLTGDALTQFIANAPAEMRDVFSGNAFSYDATTKRLRVVLRTKSTVLGEAGPYDVPL
jgi:hypothetical protein